LLAWTLAGCGGEGNPDTIPVTGTVNLDGSAIEGATVILSPTEGRPAIGTTDANGKFTLKTFEDGDGALPGNHSVTITKVVTSGGEADPEDEMIMGEADDIKTQYIIPPRYGDAKLSGLKCEVKDGMEPLVFNLQSR
jgi:hypothetical protein